MCVFCIDELYERTAALKQLLDFAVHNESNQNCTSFGKTKLSSSFANRNIQNDYGKKEEPKEGEPLNVNNSTLSLHINAYENSIEAISCDPVDCKKDGTKKNKENISSSKSWKAVKEILNDSSVKYAYELPRQQQDQPTDPEVMGFKASQQLSNVNQPHPAVIGPLSAVTNTVSQQPPPATVNPAPSSSNSRPPSAITPQQQQPRPGPSVIARFAVPLQQQPLPVQIRPFIASPIGQPRPGFAYTGLLHKVFDGKITMTTSRLFISEQHYFHKAWFFLSFQQPFHFDMSNQSTQRNHGLNLDSWQSSAISCINNDQSIVFAGFTPGESKVVAVQAIDRALSKQRYSICVVSSQSGIKFFEFSRTYNIPIKFVTSINEIDRVLQSASPCLIMTTDAFFCQIANNIDYTNHFEWIILSEIGRAAMQECINLVPANAKLLVCSYTLEDADSFADSIAEQKQSVCHVVEAFKVDRNIIFEDEFFQHTAFFPKFYYDHPFDSSKTDVHQEYAFDLDPFQLASIKCINNGHNVLVAAHTSAGKTVIAQQAIDVALGEKQRVIYTAPIKALSNQKFHEFSVEKVPVGLMTGDTVIKQESPCLVMTTEILLNLLRNNISYFDDVAWVIFDEVHYIADRERGSVWEQCIALLPKRVKLVFLSASIPNGDVFASWVVSLKKNVCHVVQTFKRPVPLRTFIHFSGKDTIQEVIDGENQLNRNVVYDAFQKNDGLSLEPKESVSKVLDAIQNEKNLPCCVFTFSRKKCGIYAKEIVKDFLVDPDAKALVRKCFRNAFDSNSRYPRQVNDSLEMLLRGIAVHHSGIYPRLKELVEVLVKNGLVKVLFATETFSVGLNVPFRTVVFTELIKHDGRQKRYVTTSEFLQMSGRAGRRGQDKYGVVVVMCDEKVIVEQLCTLLESKAEPLISNFHLSHSDILNCINSENFPTEFFMKSSFLYYCFLLLKQQSFSLDQFNPYLKEQLYGLTFNQKKLSDLQQKCCSMIMKHEGIFKFLKVGQVIEIFNAEKDLHLGKGVILKVEKTLNPDAEIGGYFFNYKVLMKSNQPFPVLSKNASELRPFVATKTENWYPVIVGVALEDIQMCSTTNYTNHEQLPANLKDIENYRNKETPLKAHDILNYVDKLIKENKVIDVKPNDLKLGKESEIFGEFSKIQDDMFWCRLNIREYQYNLKMFHRDYELQRERYDLFMKVQQEMKAAKDSFDKEEMEMLKGIELLKEFKCLTDEEVLTPKGRVCAAIKHSSSLLITESIFKGILSNIHNCHEIAAIFSCFVCNEYHDIPPLSETLNAKYAFLKNLKDTVYKEIGAAVVKPHMMPLTEQFVVGVPVENLNFGEIYPGSFIFCLRQLSDLLKSVCEAVNIRAYENTRKELEETYKKIQQLFSNFKTSLYDV